MSSSGKSRVISTSEWTEAPILGAAPFNEEHVTGQGMDVAETQSAGQPQERKRHRTSAYLPKKPKKAASAYSNFIKAYYKKNKDTNISSREKIVQAAQAWHHVASDERAALDKKCEKDRERYRKEMEVWKKQKAFLKRPPTAYGLFVRDMWANEKEKDAGNGMEFLPMNRNVANLWNELGDEKKEEYRARHEKLMRHHTEKMWHVRQTGLPNLNWMTQGLPLEEAYPVLNRSIGRRRGRQQRASPAPARSRRGSRRAEEN